MESGPAIEVMNLTVQQGGSSLIKDFSLCLEYGEKVVLTGRSGSGKTTFLRCLFGFVVPESGLIRIGGEMLTGKTVWQLRTRLAYVPQEPDLGEGSVREIIEQPFTYRSNKPAGSNLEKIPELFDRFQLSSGLLDKEIGNLSGGEKQRVAIVLALLLDRKIFLLDEPFSALDKHNRQAVQKLFSKQDDKSVLLVSHDFSDFSDSCRVVEFPNKTGETD